MGAAYCWLTCGRRSTRRTDESLRRAQTHLGLSLHQRGERVPTVHHFLQERADLVSQPLHALVQACAQTKTGLTGALRAHECGRRLSKSLHRLDPTAPLLPIDSGLRRRTIARQRQPHVYSEAQIGELLKSARTLPSPHTPWWPGMLYTMVVLMYCAGLRIGELVRLDLADVHFEDNTVEIRESKFFKSRRLPLTPSVMRVLKSYLADRERCGAPCTGQSGLFWNPRRGDRYAFVTVHAALVKLIRRAGLKPANGAVGPRIHDLRHTFVLHRMREWYRGGIDVQARLPYLASYLGHKDISSTLSCLTMEDLKAVASERFRQAGARALRTIEVQP
jgi:integrase/recombinase XerD